MRAKTAKSQGTYSAVQRSTTNGTETDTEVQMTSFYAVFRDGCDSKSENMAHFLYIPGIEPVCVSGCTTS